MTSFKIPTEAGVPKNQRETWQEAAERVRGGKHRQLHPLVYKELKFAPSPRETLRAAEKKDTLAATIRHNDEKEIAVGDHLRLLKAEPKPQRLFGTAVVEHVAEVRVDQALAVGEEYEAEYGMADTSALRNTLNQYYHAAIHANTTVKVIILKPQLENQPLGKFQSP